MVLKILLDSHAFVWFAMGHCSCSPGARAAIEDEDALIYVSAATLWELATKHRLGKWAEVGPLLAKYPAVLSQYDFRPLPITLEHGLLAGSYTTAHKDPFDRMLAAQAQIEDLVLVTADPAFQTFGTRTLW